MSSVEVPFDFPFLILASKSRDGALRAAFRVILDDDSKDTLAIFTESLFAERLKDARPDLADAEVCQVDTPAELIPLAKGAHDDGARYVGFDIEAEPTRHPWLVSLPAFIEWLESHG